MALRFLSSENIDGNITAASGTFVRGVSDFAVRLDSINSSTDNDLRFAKGGVDYGAIQTGGGSNDLEFYVNDGSTWIESFRVQRSTGNVGIGLNPASSVVLDVKEPDSSNDLIVGLTAGTGARAQIRSVVQSANTESAISFHTTLSGSTQEKLRILATGALSVGNSGTNYGTSGQILTSTGNAVPQWTTPTTGTVTGTGVDNRIAIWNGTTAIDSDSDFYVDGDTIFTTNLEASGAGTFAGNVNTNGDYLIDSIQILDTSSTYTQIRNPEGDRCIFLGDSADRGNYYDNDVHYFRTAGGGTIKMTLGVQLNPRVDVVPITDSLYDLGKNTIRWANVWADNFNGGTLINGSGTANDIVMWQDSDTLTDAPIAISGNNATFAGNIITSGDIELNGANKYIYLRTGTNSGLWQEDNFSLRFGTNNIEALELDNSQNATFAGNVSVGPKSNATVTVSESGGATIKMIAGSVGRIGTYTADDFRIVTDSTDRLTIDSSGNVGIGTTSPSTKLDVAGIIRIAESGNTAFYGGDNVRLFGTQAFRFLNSGGSTIAQVSLTGNSYLNGGNVGIGTTTPGDKLNIHNSSANANLGIKITRGSQTHGLRLGVNDSHAFLWTDQNQDLAFATNNTQRLTIAAGGNVGIGTTSPTAKLEVVCANGDNAFRANFGSSADIFMGFDNSNPYLILQDNGNTTTHNFKSNDTNNYIVGSNLGIGTTSPARPLSVNSSQISARFTSSSADSQIEIIDSSGSTVFGSSSGNAIVQAGGAERMRINSSGNVGIGTTLPSDLLTVTNSGTGDAALRLQTTTGGDPTIYFNSAAANRSGLIRYQDNGTNMGRIEYVHNGDRIAFQAGSATGETLSIINGAVGINITNPGQKLTVQGDGSGTSDVVRIIYGNGSHSGNGLNIRSANSGKVLYAEGSVGAGFAEITTAYNANPNFRISGDVVAYATSDKRFKDNLETIENPINKINKLNGYTFDWNNKQDVYKGKDYGVVAQEVEKIMPELVDTRFDGYKAVKYEKLIPLLIESIKELEARVKELEKK